MSVLTQSMSCSSYKDKVNQMYLSSYSTSTSSNAIDEASKTFLLSGRKAEKRDRTLSINKALKTGNIKDIHIDYSNDRGLFIRKRSEEHRKRNGSKERIQNYSRELSCNVKREISNNKRPYMNNEDVFKREIEKFLSLAPTHYNKGLRTYQKDKIQSYFVYSKKSTGNNLKDMVTKNLFSKFKSSEL